MKCILKYKDREPCVIEQREIALVTGTQLRYALINEGPLFLSYNLCRPLIACVVVVQLCYIYTCFFHEAKEWYARHTSAKSNLITLILVTENEKVRRMES